MRILVINTGSSSIKYQVFKIKNMEILCSGMLERIGESKSQITFKHSKKEANLKFEKAIPSHKEGMKEIVKLLLDKEWGAISDISEIQGVGHRIVHGGDIKESEIVTAKTLTLLKKAIPLAPLHNPPSLLGIKLAMEIFPHATHTVVIDTTFHKTLPPEAFMYPLPYKYYEKFKIRKYGFHGTSHKYVSERYAEITKKPLEEVNLITVHLGNGSSISAIRNGKCIDTSMGFTPLDGLMMGTRCGSIDSAIIGFLANNNNMSISEIDEVLRKKSGLLGISGASDLRNVLSMAEQGNTKAQLALDMLCYRIKHYIGAYIGILGVSPEAIIFTAGIGENSSYIRANCLKNMEHLGIKIDLSKNENNYSSHLDFSDIDSKIKTLAIRTNEELEIAKQTYLLINKE